MVIPIYIFFSESEGQSFESSNKRTCLLPQQRQHQLLHQQHSNNNSNRSPPSPSIPISSPDTPVSPPNVHLGNTTCTDAYSDSGVATSRHDQAAAVAVTLCIPLDTTTTTDSCSTNSPAPGLLQQTFKLLQQEAKAELCTTTAAYEIFTQGVAAENSSAFVSTSTRSSSVTSSITSSPSFVISSAQAVLSTESVLSLPPCGGTNTSRDDLQSNHNSDELQCHQQVPPSVVRDPLHPCIAGKVLRISARVQKRKEEKIDTGVIASGSLQAAHKKTYLSGELTNAETDLAASIVLP